MREVTGQGGNKDWGKAGGQRHRESSGRTGEGQSRGGRAAGAKKGGTAEGKSGQGRARQGMEGQKAQRSIKSLKARTNQPKRAATV